MFSNLHRGRSKTGAIYRKGLFWIVKTRKAEFKRPVLTSLKLRTKSSSKMLNSGMNCASPMDGSMRFLKSHS